MAIKEKGIIVEGGMGGFLNPPTHPEHHYSVEYNLHRKRDDRSSMSLSSAIECTWLDVDIRNKAKALLQNWVRPNVNSEEIQDWIHQVLGYFSNCYSPDGDNRNVSDCVIMKGNPMTNGYLENHLGVMFIRKFYADYEFKQIDFDSAYWGKKEVPTNADGTPKIKRKGEK